MTYLATHYKKIKFITILNQKKLKKLYLKTTNIHKYKLVLLHIYMHFLILRHWCVLNVEFNNKSWNSIINILKIIIIIARFIYKSLNKILTTIQILKILIKSIVK